MIVMSLPDPGSRWTPRKKAVVVCAIKAGLITEKEALKRYGMTKEEISCLVDKLKKHGVNGLKTTKIQELR